MEKLLELASINSIWRGKDYCEGHMVQSWSKTSPTTYEGTVASKNEPETVYHVSLDREHPKRSTCDCPFANGRRVICKHMVALFFTAEPGFLEKFIFEEEALEREEEKEREEQEERVRAYVMRLSKRELQEKLIAMLMEDDRSEALDWT